MKPEAKSAPFRVTVGLLWHSLTSGNLGVGALTESNIAIVRKTAEALGMRVCFIVLGTASQGLEELAVELRAAGHELEIQRTRVFRRSFRDLVRRCAFVLDIGEGDSFADIYGFKRFFYLWLSKNLVCSLNKPLILSPQTIGPFDGTVARLLATQVMKRCRTVFARDHLSTDYLHRLGLAARIDEATDVAFRLPFERKRFAGEEVVRVGVNVSGLLFNGGYTGGNQFGLSLDYPATIRQLLAEFCQLPGVEVHLVSHVIEPNMPVEDDLAVAKSLAQEFPRVIVASPFVRPSQAKSYIAGLDFFCGARMHACIAAFSSGVPVVPMAYSRKFNGLFGSLGYNHIADCKRDSQDEVIHKIVEAFERRNEIKLAVYNSLNQINQRLARYESCIETEFRIYVVRRILKL